MGRDNRLCSKRARAGGVFSGEQKNLPPPDSNADKRVEEKKSIYMRVEPARYHLICIVCGKISVDACVLISPPSCVSASEPLSSLLL
jgi:hypothetical protein